MVSWVHQCVRYNAKAEQHNTFVKTHNDKISSYLLNGHPEMTEQQALDWAKANALEKKTLVSGLCSQHEAKVFTDTYGWS